MNCLNQSVYSKPVSFKNIMKFSFPTIVMTVFMSFYTMADGLFVSNFIGTNALSAINLTTPVITFVTAISTMLATGGSAVVMRKMGERKHSEAREDFTLLILGNVAIGLVMTVLGFLLMDIIYGKMGLSAEVLGYCKDYLSYYLIFTIPILLMNNFILYMIAAGKSGLSLVCSAAGGVLNIALDYVFIVHFHMGIQGAAIATGLGYSVTAVVGLFTFADRNSLIHFKKPVWRAKVLFKAASNGASEMATSLVTGITTMLFNWKILQHAGEDGVAAITIIMYVLMFTTSLYTGYTYGVAPMISYYHGEMNEFKLKKLINRSLKIISAISFFTVFISFFITEPLVSVFTKPDNPVYGLAVTGNKICTFALLFIGFNVFASGMFTALSNGLISALLAFSRSFLCMAIAIMALPALFGITGIWLATPVAEAMAICMSMVMFVKYKKRYRY